MFEVVAESEGGEGIAMLASLESLDPLDAILCAGDQDPALKFTKRVVARTRINKNLKK